MAASPSIDRLGWPTSCLLCGRGRQHAAARMYVYGWRRRMPPTTATSATAKWAARRKKKSMGRTEDARARLLRQISPGIEIGSVAPVAASRGDVGRRPQNFIGRPNTRSVGRMTPAVRLAPSSSLGFAASTRGGEAFAGDGFGHAWWASNAVSLGRAGKSLLSARATNPPILDRSVDSMGAVDPHDPDGQPKEAGQQAAIESWRSRHRESTHPPQAQLPGHPHTAHLSTPPKSNTTTQQK